MGIGVFGCIKNKHKYSIGMNVRLCLCVTLICGAVENSSAQGSGESATIGQTRNDLATETFWLPKLNATCRERSLIILAADNPNCVLGKFVQKRLNCSDTNCVRTVNCSAEESCSEWSEWLAASDCCSEERCDFNGTSFNRSHSIHTRTRTCDITGASECEKEKRETFCGGGRAAEGDFPTNEENNPASNSHVRTLAFALAGMVMVGLMLFAVIRIRKATVSKQSEIEDRHRVEGVDNEALVAAGPESRVQAILNSMNSNGQHYELRERSDSTPGRRVYVISPSGSQSSQRGRVFSRAAPQLSSIAEESTEDALSHITEATEPLEEDLVFKYDSDTINQLENNDSAFGDEQTIKPASSTEAIDCINDVIAMYDVDKDSDMNEVLNRNSVISHSDFRKSSEVKPTDYLSDFGWKPQERPWSIAKLKDESAPKTMTSCSTLNSMYLSNLSIASHAASSVNSEANIADPLLNSDQRQESNLSRMKAFSSMPTVLDTSQIPDIEEVLSIEQNGVTES